MLIIRKAGAIVLLSLLLSACSTLPASRGRLAPLPRRVVFAGQTVPLSNPAVRARIADWYNFYLSKPWQVARWLGRARRFFPIIQRTFAHDGLPRDLEYVAVAESNLAPRAVSGAGAGGLWQFTPSTAKEFGLPVDRFVDERFDPRASSRAAGTYFRKSASAIPGGWLLRIAAFNLGVRGVTQRVMRQKSDNFWQMVFPPQTEDYVPRIIAIKLVMEHAAALGIEPEDLLPPLAVVSISVPSEPVYLTDVAAHLGLSFRQIWEDNPQLWKPYLPPGSYRLSLPEQFAGDGSKLSTFLDSRPYRRATYTAPGGESVAKAAARLGITADELATWNGLSRSQKLTKGQQLTYWRTSPSH